MRFQNDGERRNDAHIDTICYVSVSSMQHECIRLLDGRAAGSILEFEREVTVLFLVLTVVSVEVHHMMAREEVVTEGSIYSSR